jgi:hypothetical protein
MTNREIVLADVNTDGLFLKKYPEFQDDYEIVMSAVIQNGLALQYVNQNLKCNSDVIITAMNQNVYDFDFIPNKVYGDVKIMHEIVKIDGFALRYASDDIRGNREIVIDAIKQEPFSLRYVTNKLHEGREIVQMAVKQLYDLHHKNCVMIEKLFLMQ